MNVPDAADRAFADGAPEMIIVMPDAFTRWHGSMYSNSVNTGDWETFIARDLVWYIDTHYRTIPLRASRGLGHSMGGYGTLRIGNEGAAFVLESLRHEPLLPSAQPHSEPAVHGAGGPGADG